MINDQNIIAQMHKKMTRTYLTGIFIAINAIRDAYLLVDGPNCVYKKAEYIDKNHDFFCDLFDIDKGHRIAHTDATPQSVIQDRTEQVKALLLQMAEHERSRAVFLCSMPSASLTGIHYDLIVNAVQSCTKTPVVELPAKNMRSDWLEAYEDVLFSIARKIPLRKKSFKKNTVAIVGYFMDRTEGDHTGNIAELKRLLKGLSLELVSVWLEGKSYRDLQDVDQAALIISFPYARRAAEHIALRTGAAVVCTDIPLGADNTARWLRSIANASGKMARVQVLINKELRSIMPLCEAVVSLYVANKKFSLAGDPYLTCAMASALRELGGVITSLVYLGKGRPNNNDPRGEELDVEILEDPLVTEFSASVFASADIGIGSSPFAQPFRDKPFVQFGFPSPGYHAFSAAPFLGYRGLICLLNRIVNVCGGPVAEGPLPE